MGKEIIKENVVAGSYAVYRRRRHRLQHRQARGRNVPSRRGGQYQFCLPDTNVNDLSSVASSSAHIYYVQTSNTQTVGGYLDYDQDALKNWFPKNAVMYDKTVSEGAGQVRAIRAWR